jgi:crossover junction endodeoxyribonuclease RuvC
VVLVLGIDPGSKYTGYGLVRRQGAKLVFEAAGRIKTQAADPLADRLYEVFGGLRAVLTEYAPQAVAVEDVFFAKNVRSAVRLGHVRGVALLAAAEAGLKVFEYPPASIKQAVVGYGRADKNQVGLMVRQLLGLRQPLPEDAADALAAAICHLNQNTTLRGAT